MPRVDDIFGSGDSRGGGGSQGFFRRGGSIGESQVDPPLFARMSPFVLAPGTINPLSGIYTEASFIARYEALGN